MEVRPAVGTRLTRKTIDIFDYGLVVSIRCPTHRRIDLSIRGPDAVAMPGVTDAPNERHAPTVIAVSHPTIRSDTVDPAALHGVSDVCSTHADHANPEGQLRSGKCDFASA